MDKFTITDKGYSIQEVNQFIDNVITQTESMLEKMKKQQSDVMFLQKEIESYKRIENELKVDDLYAEIRLEIIKALLEEGYTKEGIFNNDISHAILDNPKICHKFIKNEEEANRIQKYISKFISKYSIILTI